MTDAASEKLPPILQWAFFYADIGFSVIPTAEGEKRPGVPWEEFQKRRPDKITIRMWLTDLYAGCAIGAVTGAISDIFVLDADASPGKVGAESLDDLQMMHDDLPQTWTVKSGGGGRHYYFRVPKGVRIKTSKNELGMHLDVRGEGGFIVLPPSVHPNGIAYEWVVGCDPSSCEIADAPAWLLELVEDRDTSMPPRSGKTGEFNDWGKRTDGREEYMRDLLWARLIEERRKGAAQPTQSALDAILDDCWAVFEMKCKARGESLAADGRGKDKMRHKLKYALKKWDTRIAAEAEKPRPDGTWDESARGWGEPGDMPPGSPPPPLTIRSVFPIDASKIPPRPWLIPGLLIRNHVTVVVAPPGVGKSLLTLQVGLALGSGRQWGGWEPRKSGRVLLINAEDDYDEMQRRMVTASIVMGIEQGEVADRVFVADTPESIVIARTDPRSKTVIRQPRVDELIKIGIDMKIDLIVVDPFAETFEGDENSNSELKWAAVLWREIARKTGGAVLLVHHTRKYASGMSGDADAARGAGALVGVARVVATMFAMTEEEAELFEVEKTERHRYVRFDSAKANLTLITGQAKWFVKQSQDVGNATAFLPSDDTGVLVPWNAPGMFDGVPPIRIVRALNAIDKGILDETGEPTGALFTRARQSPKRWAGSIVIEEFSCDEERASAVIKAWLTSGLLFEVEYEDGKQTRKGLKVDFTKRPGATT